MQASFWKNFKELQKGIPVRILVLILSVAFVTSSCDFESSSTSILSLALPSATTAAIGATSLASSGGLHNQNCAFSVGTEPDATTQASLLRNLAGVWRDSLGNSVESDLNIRSQDGLRFGDGERPGLAQIELGRAIVSIASSEPPQFDDDFKTLGFKSVSKSSSFQLGQTSNDGFTALQARFQESNQTMHCLIYALKVNQMADGRQVLLVRGPIEQQVSGQAKSVSTFFYLVRDTTRMLTR